MLQKFHNGPYRHTSFASGIRRDFKSVFQVGHCLGYYLGAFEALLNPLNEDISRKPGFASVRHTTK